MKKILFIPVAVLMMLSLTACGEKWTCDRCDKTFRGEAYYGMDYDDTYCAECAADYWSPFPYKNYSK